MTEQNAAVAEAAEDFSGIPGAQDAQENLELQVIPNRTVVGWVLTGVSALDVTDPKDPFFSLSFEAVAPEPFKGRKFTQRLRTSNAKMKGKKPPHREYVFWNINVKDALKIVAGILFETPANATRSLYAGLSGLGTVANPLTDHTLQLVKPVIENLKKLCGQGTLFVRMRVRKLDDGAEVNEFGAVAFPKNDAAKELGLPPWAIPGDTSEAGEYATEEEAAMITSEADLVPTSDVGVVAKS